MTRHRPKTDGIVRFRFIRQTVDPDARFLFESPSDVEDLIWRQHGPLCTSGAMPDEFELHTDAPYPWARDGAREGHDWSADHVS